MPGGDRTGPMGMGPMTGRAAGYCAGSGEAGYAVPIARRGFGMGFGRGRGWRHMYYATGAPAWMRSGPYGGPYGGAYPYPPPYHRPDPQMEKRDLQSQAAALRSELDAIEKRIAEIEGAPEGE